MELTIEKSECQEESEGEKKRLVLHITDLDGNQDCSDEHDCCYSESKVGIDVSIGGLTRGKVVSWSHPYALVSAVELLKAATTTTVAARTRGASQLECNIDLPLTYECSWQEGCIFALGQFRTYASFEDYGRGVSLGGWSLGGCESSYTYGGKLRMLTSC